MSDRSVDYDRIAQSFDERYRANEYGGVERALLAFVGSAERVLEVGCGTGHWLSLLAQKGVGVAGIDASREMLERARAILPAAELIHGQAEQLPWPEASFDRVVCINALHHFGEPPAFVAEARRVLRPEGGLMVVGLDPHTELDRWWIYDRFADARDADRARYPAAAQIREWMAAAGLRDAHSFVAQHIELELPALLAWREGRLAKSSTSQLVLLSEEVYRAGIDGIVSEAQALEALGETMALRVDLRLWVTIATIAAP